MQIIQLFIYQIKLNNLIIKKDKRGCIVTKLTSEFNSKTIKLMKNKFCNWIHFFVCVFIEKYAYLVEYLTSISPVYSYYSSLPDTLFHFYHIM